MKNLLFVMMLLTNTKLFAEHSTTAGAILQSAMGARPVDDGKLEAFISAADFDFYVKNIPAPIESCDIAPEACRQKREEMNALLRSDDVNFKDVICVSSYSKPLAEKPDSYSRFRAHFTISKGKPVLNLPALGLNLKESTDLLDISSKISVSAESFVREVQPRHPGFQGKKATATFIMMPTKAEMDYIFRIIITGQKYSQLIECH